ncbi:MAG TPA: hypothetical protein VEB22_02410 [Phycisphaerales bacterium]|nr:hypothetical protein [Phycisphaerales bacterium]
MINPLFRVSLLALVLAAGGATAYGDDDKNQPPLKGPKVPERQVPGVDNGLGTMESGGDKKGVAREMPIPHREFMRMLNEAVGEQAPEGVRLSPEQREQVEKISREFSEKQRTYAETNRGEIERLVEKYGPEVRQLTQRLMAARGGMPGGDAKHPSAEGRRPGKDGKPGEAPAGEPDGMKREGGLSDDARAEVVAKLKELQAAAPKPEDARTAIWGVLKTPQQAAVQTKVDAFKAQREKQQDERYKEREKKKLEERGTKKSTGAPGAEPAKVRPGDGDAGKPLDAARRTELLNQLPDDLKAQVSKLPEQAQSRILGRMADLKTEQREEFYSTLRERLKNAEGQRRPK